MFIKFYRQAIMSIDIELWVGMKLVVCWYNHKIEVKIMCRIYNIVWCILDIFPHYSRILTNVRDFSFKLCKLTLWIIDDPQL